MGIYRTLLEEEVPHITDNNDTDEQMKELMASLEVGDSILTTSGFYGVIVDNLDESTIIVEFGNDKHCRIPMEKSAVTAVEKANADKEEDAG